MGDITVTVALTDTDTVTSERGPLMPNPRPKPLLSPNPKLMPRLTPGMDTTDTDTTDTPTDTEVTVTSERGPLMPNLRLKPRLLPGTDTDIVVMVTGDTDTDMADTDTFGVEMLLKNTILLVNL